MQERPKQIAEMVHEGASVAEAAKFFQVSIRTVRYACQLHNVKNVSPYRQEIRERQKQIAEIVDGGASITEAAWLFQVNIRTARYACRLHNVKNVSPSKQEISERTKERRKQMAEMVDGGASVAEVAMFFQVNGATVRYACRLHGVVSKVKNQLGPSTYRVIAALINTNDSITEICESLRIAEPYVRIILSDCKKAGIITAKR
jgi:transposase